MFTGIIEQLGKVIAIENEGTNVHFTIESPLASQLKIDQSVAHNGVCLTVVAQTPTQYRVTAVLETLQRTNLGDWKVGDFVNLERALAYGGRMDGHLVQGHVDAVGICTRIENNDGSWAFHFEYTPNDEHLLVDKGSVTVNGVSLTVVQPTTSSFSVAIIPYTFEHTVFQYLRMGDKVNLEFDIIGKYMAKYVKLYLGQLVR